MGVAAPSALLSSAASVPVAAQIRGGANLPPEPKVFTRDDGRHSAGTDQFEPPLDRSDVTRSIDQLIGSGVDALLFSVGVEGGTVVYDSKVAQKLGDNVDRWTHPVHYRDGRHLRQLVADGHDRIKLLCDRAHRHGIFFVASLCLDPGSYISPRGHGRTSDFVFNNPKFQVGKDEDPRAADLSPTRFGFLHGEVRRERFRIFEELLTRYETDGVELFFDSPPPCRLNQVAEFGAVFTQWLRDLRAVAANAEQSQGRRKRVFITIPAAPEAWKLLGFDVAAWVREKLVDGLLCASTLPEKMDHDLDVSRAVTVTRGTFCRVIASYSSRIERQLHKKATQPMIWAAASSAYRQGADGVCLDDAHWFAWPWNAGAYETLRLLGDPALLATADKLYRARSSASKPSPLLPETGSVIPGTLQVGQPVSVPLMIGDDLAAAHALGRVQSVQLRVRITNIDAALNEVSVELNGRRLPREVLHPNDLTYRILGDSAVSPYGYIFTYHLPPEHFPKPGKNLVSVTLVKRDPDLDAPFDLYDVDCAIQFRQHRNFEKTPIEY